MPKVLLKIGYYTLLLPNDTGVPTLMKTLSKAVEVSESYSDGPDYQRKITLKKEASVQMEYLPRKVQYKTEDEDEGPLRLNP